MGGGEDCKAPSYSYRWLLWCWEINNSKENTIFLPSFSIIPTGVVRAIYYGMSNEKDKVCSCHTYDLYKYSVSDKQLFENFVKQAQALFRPIIEISRFARTEKQNFVIEGNHILPELRLLIREVNCFDLYLRVNSDTQLINNMQSTTHKRILSEKQVKTAVKLNRFLAERLSGLPGVFSIGEDDRILEYVGNKIEDLLRES